MSTFTYKARDDSGKAVDGTMEAESQEQLVQKLRRMGYMPTRVTEKSPAAGFLSEDLGQRFQRIKVEDMIIFNLQLANMIEAGLLITTSLRTIAQQIENRKLKQIVGEVQRAVEGGSTFSDALAQHPKVFSKLCISMVHAGETSGNLPLVLHRFARYTEAQEDLRQKINNALFYPMILLCAGIGVIVFIVTYVMPQFVDIFQKAGVTLPLPTEIIYTVGQGIKKFWYLILLGLMALVVGFKQYIATEGGRLWFDRLCLHLPVVGPVVRRVVVSRFCRTLATLIDSAVPILQALEILKNVVGSKVFANVVQNLHDAVQQGEKIAQPLKVSDEFPPDAIQMIAAGEETGKLGQLLNKVADFYDTMIEYSIKKLTTLIEPIFLVVMGGMVGLIMASMLLPMFDMVKTLRS